MGKKARLESKIAVAVLQLEELHAKIDVFDMNTAYQIRLVIFTLDPDNKLAEQFFGLEKRILKGK